MTIADWSIVIVYLAAVAALGFAFTRRQRRPDEFYLAGRSMRSLPIGLSVMATVFSGINYVGFSGEVAQFGMYVLLSIPVFLIVAWPVTRVIMPFYHSMRLCSAYEYLEKRFDVRVRCLASALFIVWRVSWMAVVLFVPCRVLTALTGVSLTPLVLVVGGLTLLYTTAGGMRSVMWTDVAQFFVLFIGLVVGVAVAAAQNAGGLAGMLERGVADGLARPFHPFDPAMFSPDPTLRITLWSALIGVFVAFLARYGADQMVVQRYFTARSLRDAQRGFHLNNIAFIATLLLLAVLGFAVHSFAARTGLLARPGLTAVDHFSAFVAALPAGMPGLIVAGILAATMSSINSGMNSCSAAFATDLYPRLRPDASAPAPLWLNRVLTLVFGSLAMLLALHVGRLGTIFEIANKIINAFGSPLLALLLLGMFSRCVNPTGMLLGGIAGAAASIVSAFALTNLALQYYAVVNLLATVFACYGFSLLAHLAGVRQKAESRAWTWWEWRKRANAG